MPRHAMPDRFTVLMYHATPTQAGGLGEADPHYAVALDTYESHLNQLQTWGMTARALDAVPAHAQQGERPVGMTFDDGHRTNLAAAHALAARGWSGTFFVNPGTIGTADYLNWSELRQMAKWGMSIQSHAQHHRYLDELSPSEQLAELQQSKDEIEQQIGIRVSVFAPPGGRTTHETAALAHQAGYAMMSTSRVSVWRPKQDSCWDVPRFAVLASTPLTRLQAWVQQSPVELSRQALRYHTLRWAKRMLGNHGYERLRGQFLGTTKDY